MHRGSPGQGYVGFVSSTRLISADMRSALLVAVGVAIPASAALLSLSEAAQVAGLAIAILVVGLGLAGTASSGRGTVPVTQQSGYDLGLAVGLAGAAVLFALVGDAPAVALFGGFAALTMLINLLTRYTPARRTENFL